MHDPLRGRFVWYELLTTDPAAAIPFYTEVVGWGTTRWDGAGPPYTMWTNQRAPIGGVMTLPEPARTAGAPPHWLPYVGTADVDATAARAAALGGALDAPGQDLPSVGRFAVLADPQRAAFAVFTPERIPAPETGPFKQGEFSWHELATTDHEAAFEFYHELFGWERTRALDLGEMGVYQMYGMPGAELPLGGMYNKSEAMGVPPHWLLYVRVASADRAVETVTRLGGTVLGGPMDVPGDSRVAQCLDPQGAAFGVHSSAS